MRLSDIIYASSNDWDGFWYQRQEFAKRFAEKGHKVYYFNKTLQRLPKLMHFIKRFGSKSQTNSSVFNRRPNNLEIVTPIWLPPLKCLRIINRQLIKKTFCNLNIVNPILITDIPSFNTVDMIDIIKPYKSIYMNIHNYDGCGHILKDMFYSEKILAKKADILFATTNYIVRRLSNISGGREVFLSPPGVNYSKFATAYRGDEHKNPQTLMYFGGIGPHMNIELYVELSKLFNVVFIGEIDKRIRKDIPETIHIESPVANDKLPELLKQADVLTIFYEPSEHVRGVFPAKFFECLATGKPLLISGLTEVNDFNEYVYYVENKQQVLDIIGKLSKSETHSDAFCRQAAAKEYSWDAIFKVFYDKIFL